MHFPLTTIIIFAHFFPSFLMKNAFKNHQDDYDTPSPAWIKYQRQRHDPKYNKRTMSSSGMSRDHHHPQQQVEGTGNRKMDFKGKVQTKIETTPRQNGASSTSTHHQAEHPDDGEGVYVEDEVKQEEKIAKEASNDDSNSNKLKYPSIQGFIGFVKSLRNTWMKKSLFRIEDKIQFLYNLKDSLMRTIEQKFTTLWSDDDNDDMEAREDDNEGRHLRRKRGILDESSIEFPPEAALMSINFLTFAVFLIKLVLQVVNIIRTKHVQISSIGGNLVNG